MDPRFIWPTVLVILYVFTLSVFVPWTLPLPPLFDAVDASWLAVLHWAFVHHVDFGRRIAYTFGPWGFTQRPFLPETLKYVVAAWTFFATIFFFAALAIVNQLNSAWWIKSLWLLAFISIIGGPNFTEDMKYLSICWLLLFYHAYIDARSFTPIKIAMVIGVGLSMLIRFSITPAGVAVIAAITLEQLWRRRMPWILVMFVIAYLGWWLAASQPLSHLGSYLHYAWSVADAYTDGEQLSVPTETFDVTAYVLCAVLVLLIPIMGHPRCRDQTGHVAPATNLFAIIGLAGVLFALFKGGYVRHEMNHEMVATLSLSLIAISLCTLFWPRVNAVFGRICIVAVPCVCVCLAWSSQLRYTDRGLAGHFVDELKQFPARAQFAAKWLSGKPALQDLYASNLRQFNHIPLPDAPGSADSVASNQIALLTRQINYDPRPVFQSYLAANPELAALNADFFSGPNAPDNVYFEVQPIDAHYPAQEDALSWLPLLSRYNVADAADGCLLLQKSPVPRSISIEPIQQMSAELGQAVDVPSIDDPVWVSIRLHPTMTGRLQRFLYKPAHILLRTRTRDGRERNWSLQTDEAPAGFLLSPCIEDELCAAMLNSPDWKRRLADDEVTRIAVQPVEPQGNCYEPHYDLIFSRLKMEHYDVSRVPGLGDFDRVERTFKTVQIARCDGVPRIISVGPAKSALLTPTTTALIVRVPPNARILHVGYGIRGRSKEPGGAAAADFFVGRPGLAGKGAQFVWGTHLDTADPAATATPKTFDIPIPQPSPAELILVAQSPKSEDPVDCYWSDIEFR